MSDERFLEDMLARMREQTEQSERTTQALIRSDKALRITFAVCTVVIVVSHLVVVMAFR